MGLNYNAGKRQLPAEAIWEMACRRSWGQKLLGAVREGLKPPRKVGEGVWGLCTAPPLRDSLGMVLWCCGAGKVQGTSRNTLHLFRSPALGRGPHRDLPQVPLSSLS